MLNSLSLQGRLVRDPESRHLDSGTLMCKFTLAQDQYAGEGREGEPLFLDVVGWGKTAEFMQNWFRKGREAIAEGTLVCRSYTDRDGNPRKAWEMKANRVHFCGPKQAESGGASRVDPDSVEYAAPISSSLDDETDPFADE